MRTICRVGTSLMVWGRKNSYFPYQCFLGPDWPIVIMTYVMIIVINVVVLAVVAPIGLPAVGVGACTGCILLYYYSAVVGTNPGIIYRDEDIPLAPIQVTVPSIVSANTEGVSGGVSPDKAVLMEEAKHTDMDDGEGSCDSTNQLLEVASSEGASDGFAVADTTTKRKSTPMKSDADGNSGIPVVPSTVPCGTCKLDRPFSARHCHYCEVCVDNLDHHCPWCGKCIGEGNIKYFSCFVGWLNFQSCYLTVVFVVYLVMTHT